MATIKECRNCGRTMAITGDGLCGGCYNASKDKTKGSPGYDQALKEAKERFNDPDYKTRAPKQSKPSTDDPNPKPKESAKLPRNIPENIPPFNSPEFDGIKPQIKSKKSTCHSDVVQVLKDRRHELMLEVDKITDAINTIQRYQAA